MSQEIQKAEQQETSIAAVIERAAKDESIDVAKMERLLEFGIKIHEREAEQHFNRDFSLALQEMPHVIKRGTISLGGKGKIPFATYEDIDKIVRKVEIKYGFARSILNDGNNLVLLLMHKDGHCIRATRPVMPDKGPGRNDVQAVGSGESYAKRYLTKNLWNITTDGEDDDGAATGAIGPGQIAEIETLIKESGSDKAAFLKFIGANSVPEIPAYQYGEAIAKLNQRINNLKSKKTA